MTHSTDLGKMQPEVLTEAQQTALLNRAAGHGQGALVEFARWLETGANMSEGLLVGARKNFERFGGFIFQEDVERHAANIAWQRDLAARAVALAETM